MLFKSYPYNLVNILWLNIARKSSDWWCNMSKKKSVLILLALLSPLVFSSNYAIANPGNGHGNGHSNYNHGNKGVGNGQNKTKNDRSSRDSLVSVNVTYDKVRPLALNYGLTGYKSLPPGIAKNLARGKLLPPGIEKKAVPASLLGQLPSYPGYEWRIVGG
ncbi:hypothetical protein C8D90_101942 [Enterobacillus tribolii]|uniref:Uncharacterized protein n=1 Tax=Enterobacillus tribolii TaxID=1487935 RepID=A0A370R4Y8_9GAMM|nr:hypothetical protein C8D90_101942 [Enterobacillus tribolii]